MIKVQLPLLLNACRVGLDATKTDWFYAVLWFVDVEECREFVEVMQEPHVIPASMAQTSAMGHMFMGHSPFDKLRDGGSADFYLRHCHGFYPTIHDATSSLGLPAMEWFTLETAGDAKSVVPLSHLMEKSTFVNPPYINEGDGSLAGLRALTNQETKQPTNISFLKVSRMVQMWSLFEYVGVPFSLTRWQEYMLSSLYDNVILSRDSEEGSITVKFTPKLAENSGDGVLLGSYVDLRRSFTICLSKSKQDQSQ